MRKGEAKVTLCIKQCTVSEQLAVMAVGSLTGFVIKCLMMCLIICLRDGSFLRVYFWICLLIIFLTPLCGVRVMITIHILLCYH